MALRIYNKNLAPRARIVLGAVLVAVSFFLAWTIQDSVRRVDAALGVVARHKGTAAFDAEAVGPYGRVVSALVVEVRDEAGELLEEHRVSAGWRLVVPDASEEGVSKGSFAVDKGDLLVEAMVLRRVLFEVLGVTVDWGRLSGVAVFVVCVLLAYVLCNHRKLVGFLDGVEGELSRVAWPKRQQVAESTAVVILSVAFLAAFMGVADVLLMTVLRLIGYYAGGAQ